MGRGKGEGEGEGWRGEPVLVFGTGYRFGESQVCDL